MYALFIFDTLVVWFCKYDILTILFCLIPRIRVGYSIYLDTLGVRFA